MNLTGEFHLPAPRATVWAALNDPAILKDCLAGCEVFEADGDNAFRCVVAASIGPVKARFNAKVTLSHIDAPKGYTLAFDGQGGAAGFGRGESQVTLEESGAGTLLRYTAKAQIGGKLAQVGSRLIDAAAKKVTDDFFAQFAARLGAAPAAGSGTAHAPPGDTHIPLWLIVVATVGFVLVVVNLLRGS
ncbi:MAG: carbon monoxide dehydrogenase subunit G [Betaproteobacteria bacterium]|nr:carbon monoxide dehydrogenase subunit G [Betaproteobacteria bacterium]